MAQQSFWRRALNKVVEAFSPAAATPSSAPEQMPMQIKTASPLFDLSSDEARAKPQVKQEEPQEFDIVAAKREAKAMVQAEHESRPALLTAEQVIEDLRSQRMDPNLSQGRIPAASQATVDEMLSEFSEFYKRAGTSGSSAKGAVSKFLMEVGKASPEVINRAIEDAKEVTGFTCYESTPEIYASTIKSMEALVQRGVSLDDASSACRRVLSSNGQATPELTAIKMDLLADPRYGMKIFEQSMDLKVGNSFFRNGAEVTRMALIQLSEQPDPAGSFVALSDEFNGINKFYQNMQTGHLTPDMAINKVLKDDTSYKMDDFEYDEFDTSRRDPFETDAPANDKSLALSV